MALFNLHNFQSLQTEFALFCKTQRNTENKHCFLSYLLQRKFCITCRSLKFPFVKEGIHNINIEQLGIFSYDFILFPQGYFYLLLLYTGNTELS